MTSRPLLSDPRTISKGTRILYSFRCKPEEINIFPWLCHGTRWDYNNASDFFLTSVSYTNQKIKSTLCVICLPAGSNMTMNPSRVKQYAVNSTFFFFFFFQEDLALHSQKNTCMNASLSLQPFSLQSIATHSLVQLYRGLTNLKYNWSVSLWARHSWT